VKEFGFGFKQCFTFFHTKMECLSLPGCLSWCR
jgi:hypothetical protein